MQGPLHRLGCEISNSALELSSPPTAPEKTKGGRGVPREKSSGWGDVEGRIVSHTVLTEATSQGPSAQRPSPSSSRGTWGRGAQAGNRGGEAPLWAADEGRGLGLTGMPDPQNPHPEGGPRRKKVSASGHRPTPTPFRITRGVPFSPDFTPNLRAGGGSTLCGPAL